MQYLASRPGRSDQPEPPQPNASAHSLGGDCRLRFGPAYGIDVKSSQVKSDILGLRAFCCRVPASLFIKKQQRNYAYYLAPWFCWRVCQFHCCHISVEDTNILLRSRFLDFIKIPDQ